MCSSEIANSHLEMYRSQEVFTVDAHSDSDSNSDSYLRFQNFQTQIQIKIQIHISDLKILRLRFRFKFQNCPDFQISEINDSRFDFPPGEVLNSDLGLF